LDGKGAWYVWAYSCAGRTAFNIGDSPSALKETSDFKQLTQGQQFVIANDNNDAGLKYIKVGQPNDYDGISQFILSTSYFKNESIREYALNGDVTKVGVDFNFKGYDSKVTVQVNPINLRGVDNNDKVVYHVRLCPLRSDDEDAKNNICKLQEDCKSTVTTTAVNDGKTIQATFERLVPRKYYIITYADIMHNNTMIKFIPYQTEVVEIIQGWTSMLSEMIGSILIGVCILFVVILICYKCFGRIKAFTEERGFELPVFGKKREYGFLGDDL